MIEIILQLHGGGGGGGTSNTNTYSRWDPNGWQSSILNSMTPQYSQYQNTSQNLLSSSNNLYSGLATQAVDYGALYNQSADIANSAMSGINNAANGNVAGYTANETNALQSVLNNTMGTNLNNWAKNGVINSSVAASGLNSIAQNAASTAAQDYNNAIQNASSNYQALLGGAATNLSNASTAQNAAQLAASNLLTDSLSAYNSGSGILGTGASTQTNASSNSSGSWLSTLASVGGAIACFVKDTLIDTPIGEVAIQNLKVGDKVWSYINGDKFVEEVLEIQEPVKQVIIEVVAEDDKGVKHFVETTLSQPFLTEKDGMVMVCDLRIGDMLKNVGKVIAIMNMGEDEVYDIRVSGNNTYFANGYIAYGRF